MAKGLRSKSKRKVKAIRRIENAPVIKETLLRTLSVDASKLKHPFVTSKTIEESNALVSVLENKTDESMDVIPEETKIESDHKIYKNLKNEHGNYPIWMNKRAIKKLKNKKKRKL